MRSSRSGDPPGMAALGVARRADDVRAVHRRPVRHPGTHVTSVGWAPGGREVDDATVVDALVCVASRRMALAPVAAAGGADLVEPLRRGVLAEEDIVELGELLAGTRVGRSSPERITTYKSVG